jgi:hypothetical protein
MIMTMRLLHGTSAYGEKDDHAAHVDEVACNRFHAGAVNANMTPMSA